RGADMAEPLNTRDILAELRDCPDPVLDEVVDFVRFLKSKTGHASLETALLSQSTFAEGLAPTGGRGGLARFVRGDVVVVPFPFSDLTQAKRRPARVVAELQGDDLVLRQITSQSVRGSYAVSPGDEDFDAGGLRQASNVRPNRLFTADDRIVLYAVGHLKAE